MTHVRWAWCFGDWAPSGRDHSPDCCEPFSSRCEASLRGQPTKGRATSLKVLKCLSCRLDSVGSAQLHFFLKPSNIWTFCSKKMSSISCVDFFLFSFLPGSDPQSRAGVHPYESPWQRASQFGGYDASTLSGGTDSSASRWWIAHLHRDLWGCL